MRLKAAIQGNLKKLMAQEVKAAKRAVTLGVKEATTGLKTAMRQQVMVAGMGQRMANTWRGNIYPKGTQSIRAAGLVYTRASKVMTGFEDAVQIKSKNGFWLAIPTPNAPKKGVGGNVLAPVTSLNIVMADCGLCIGEMAHRYWWWIIYRLPIAAKQVRCGGFARPAGRIGQPVANSRQSSCFGWCHGYKCQS